MRRHLTNFFLVVTLAGFGTLACSSGSSGGTGGTATGGAAGAGTGGVGGGAGAGTGGAAGAAGSSGTGGAGGAGGQSAAQVNLAIINAAPATGVTAVTPSRTAPAFTSASCP